MSESNGGCGCGTIIIIILLYSIAVHIGACP
jgi:hypothetical protein